MYFLLFIVLIVLQIGYFRIAGHFNIIDKPNERSSHKEVTIRGGGIIIALASFLWFGIYGFHHPLMIMGLLLMSVISFLDDLLTLSNKIRIIVHLLAVSMMFGQTGLFILPWYILPFAYILTIGWINAFNFMDGINGITPFYSLIALVTFLGLNQQIAFANNDFIVLLLLSVLVFGFFNARKHAKCFAGDVGSVSLAFLLAWLMICLMVKTGRWEYIVFFGVYAVDSVLTIIHRLVKHENIFQAHRSHLFQYLSNEFKWPHVLVSGSYALLQLGLNLGLILILKEIPGYSVVYVIVSLSLLSVLYIGSKYFILSKLEHG
jgi:UDP-N-acetylmuramyl pentapeptide phosphotransferase/UDP-N-acetylglucosamine-1-phosphate transferase